MPKCTINGIEVEFQPGMTVLQAAEIAGAEIPRFCYHERLKIAGNCRMCLVQIEGGPPKPAASCAMPAAEGMKVHTNTPMVKKAREGVMEFLLINHPLDCPICDQAGECDLQDETMAYGRGSSRYDENKRAVKDKYFGPLIKTTMTRCIHCTRCVRFMAEIAGVEELGATGRGEHMEVGTFIEKGLASELSGNIIDLCPVGALTSKPYAFKARSWELKKTESIDVLDAVGSNIRIDARGNEVMRILPRLNESINEEWISDKTRFACDGLLSQRLDRPYIRVKGKLQPATWGEALQEVARKFASLEGKQIAAIAGDMADCEAMTVLKDVMTGLGSPHLECRQDGAAYDAAHRASYIFNTTIEGIEQADACLIIGANPRHEAPLVNARLRKTWFNKGLKIANVGAELDLTFPVQELGESPEMLELVLSGRHPFSKVMSEAKQPMIIIGNDVMKRSDAEGVLEMARKLAEKFNVVRDGWNGLNLLQKAAARVGGLDLGFVPQKGGKDLEGILSAVEKGEIKAVFLLGADEIDMSRLKKAFVVYQGHHGDAGASNADVVLPGAAYTEKNATYVNLEGRVQQARLAVFPPGEAKEDWKILAELADALGVDVPYTSLKEIRVRMMQIAPHFGRVGEVMPAQWKKAAGVTKITKRAIGHDVMNFYMTDAISRASKTMAKCTAEFVRNTKEVA